MAHGLFLVRPRETELREIDRLEPAAGQARVRVAGCGLCHTDVGFFTGQVKTRHALPLTLGHEIAGVVEAAAPPYDALVGAPVIVPAVMPCGSCPLCADGHDTACAAQLMPGNDLDGGFATHIQVPAAQLVRLPADLRGHSLADLAVIADAVTTPFQALRRANVGAGDLVVIIGAGGIGLFAVQIAQALGAAVAAIDIDPARLERAAAYGARWTLLAPSIEPRAIKARLSQEHAAPTSRWRIFEMSGTAAGQQLAWSLLAPASTLGVIGFTMEKLELRLSNLMAFDATAFGSWGCSPRLYPAAIALVLEGRVQVSPFVERQPLEAAPEILARAAAGHLGSRRTVFVPA
jgi:6-hydroxycyclohex-1-ene-1-carbonyl-CoA dehydrogenase